MVLEQQPKEAETSLKTEKLRVVVEGGQEYMHEPGEQVVDLEVVQRIFSSVAYNKNTETTSFSPCLYVILCDFQNNVSIFSAFIRQCLIEFRVRSTSSRKTCWLDKLSFVE